MASLDMLQRNDTSLANTVDLEKAACYIPSENSLIEYSLNVSAEIEYSNLSLETEIISSPIDDTKRFMWSEGIMGMVNIAYFFGYVPMIIPGTVLANHMGFYNYISFLLLSTSLLTATFPVITIAFGAYGAGVSRLILGAIHGPVTSMISGSWYYWSLRCELTKTPFFIGRRHFCTTDWSI